ncbi:uncharacterized protein DUF3164 [Azorhizobium sp. AG788]|uniref:DUF3164 family protein n=1 Tax=Azorhizobium sp. AG788 TaxID=2183897 RepID=UPI00106119E9|nr:DUF3164 family protein [Azorhizobium sp. AG788]TDT88074.1 uncharacterized protein DUF3164 [Azorhizobium sp. AG788]
MDSESSAMDGVIEMGGNRYMTDPQGHLVPVDLVKPQDALEDQTVRKIIRYADDLSARIARFRGHTFDDVASFVSILAERYGATRGGAKGNTTLTSFDGCLKVVVQVQDVLTFGPELQVAKAIVDECVAAWSDGAPAEVRALVQHAFQTDREGRINRAALFSLRRLKIERAPWPRAMAALDDAIRVVGSREYVRFYRRANARAKWEPITIDLASAA